MGHLFAGCVPYGAFASGFAWSCTDVRWPLLKNDSLWKQSVFCQCKQISGAPNKKSYIDWQYVDFVVLFHMRGEWRMVGDDEADGMTE